MILPDTKKELIKKTLEIIERCRISVGTRAAMARTQAQWIETGRASGSRALVNKLYAHNDRLTAHLFSPSDLRFIIDYEAHYPENIIAQAEMASRVLTREWERKDIDITFGAGVGRAVDYGACIIKQVVGNSGVTARLVMPWQFGVDREDINGLSDQEAICETTYLSPSEVWRRISHLDNATELYKRIISNAQKGTNGAAENSFFHQVLSTSTLNTDLNSPRNSPGGIVQLSNDPTYAMMGPEVAGDLVEMHELYVVDEALGDYTTIQIIEPDILICPLFKRKNLFAPQTLPYTLIQPNPVTGYFWGRSEISDLMEPQSLLATWFDDIRRVMGCQYDKLLAFAGGDGITDELYDQSRAQGYFTLGQGGSVQDLTPKLPAEAFTAIELISKSMNEISGFDNIMSGQGESGVRAGNHAETLMKAAAPRLRDRSLLVERQCADAADKTLTVMEAKDAKAYFTDQDTQKASEFLLSQLPEDRRVSVDGHSSSPIFTESRRDLIGFGIRAGFVDGESAIEMLEFPYKDRLISRYRKAQAQKAELVKEHPEILTHQKQKK